MKKFLLIAAALLLTLTSCQAVESPKIDGKIAFNSVRTISDIENRNTSQDSLYLLKNGNYIFLGKNLLHPSFSPDGKTIACSVIKERSIVLLDEKGKIKKSLSLSTQPGDLEWFPDGHGLFFIMFDTTLQRIVLQQCILETGESRKLVDLGPGVNIAHGNISPDGKRIVFDTLYYENGMPVGATYLCRGDGSDVQKICNQGISGNWFPDGKTFLYWTKKYDDGSDVGGSFGAVFKRNAETGNMQKIRNLNFLPLKGLKLSEDGKYIYMSKSDPSGGETIQIWPIDDPQKIIFATKPQVVGSGYSEDYNPDWFQGE